jgi:hypothetical protein
MSALADSVVDCLFPSTQYSGDLRFVSAGRLANRYCWLLLQCELLQAQLCPCGHLRQTIEVIPAPRPEEDINGNPLSVAREQSCQIAAAQSTPSIDAASCDAESFDECSAETPDEPFPGSGVPLRPPVDESVVKDCYKKLLDQKREAGKQAANELHTTYAALINCCRFLPLEEPDIHGIREALDRLRTTEFKTLHQDLRECYPTFPSIAIRRTCRISCPNVCRSTSDRLSAKYKAFF